MRIGFDARMFGPRVGGGGLGRYVEELVTHLTRYDDGNDYVIFLKKENFHAFKTSNPRVEKVMADIHWYGAREQLEFPRIIARAKLDHMHFPHWNVPFVTMVPYSVTIHDLILLEEPQSARTTTRGPFVHAIKTAGFRMVLTRALYGARHIIAVSDTAKRSILRHFRLPANKITTVYHGVHLPVDDKDVRLADLGVYPPYLLMLGNSYPHKNHQTILAAMPRLRSLHPHLQFIAAGKVDVFAERLLADADRVGLGRDIFRYVNLPTDAEVTALMRHAALLVFPSRIEGFGWPPLEAMTLETPTLVSDIPIHREIFQNFTTFLPPDDVDAWASGIHNMLIHPPSPEARADARRFAVSFSWETCAEKTRDVILHSVKRL